MTKQSPPRLQNQLQNVDMDAAVDGERKDSDGYKVTNLQHLNLESIDTKLAHRRFRGNLIAEDKGKKGLSFRRN